MPMGIGLGLTFTLAEAAGGKWWPSGSALAFEFDNQRGFNSIDRTKTTPDSILTYTSPSPKLVYGSDGVLGYAPHNLLTYSEQFDNAAWTKTASTVVSNAATAPNGTQTADKVVPDNSIAGGRVIFSRSFTAGLHTASVYAKAGEWSWVALGRGNSHAYIDISNGTVGTVAAGYSATVTSVGDGWYRCTLSWDDAGGGSSFRIYMTNGDNTLTTGDGASGLYLWGAQLNLGSSALTYIPTTTAAVYSLPIDHDPITFDPLGVLIEEQRTNLLTYSDQFDNAAWTNNRSSESVNSIAAPDGTTTADTLIEDGTSGQHTVAQTVTTTAATSYTLSAFFKAKERSTAILVLDTTFRANFDLSLGTVATTTGSPTSTSIQSVGNGWYRCSITATVSSVSTACTLSMCDITTGFSYAGDGTSGIYIWGAQLEGGAFPTSYIPTVASQVTRAADQVSILTSAFGFNAAEGTVAVELTPDAAGAAYAVSSLDDGTAANRMDSRASSTRHLDVIVGGVTQASIDAGTISANVATKLTTAYQVNDFAACINGGTVATDTVGTIPTVTTFRIGRNYDGAGQFAGHIKRLTYFPTRKSNADLQSLTV
jgi:hypothetical protein